ncbi:hypothetical protein EOM81_11830 [bacterium]|nr:hypothetical protein [bacterium]
MSFKLFFAIALIVSGVVFFSLSNSPMSKTINAIVTDDMNEMIAFSGAYFVSDELISGQRFITIKLSQEIPWLAAMNALVQKGSIKIMSADKEISTNEFLQTAYNAGNMQSFMVMENLLTRKFIKIFHFDHKLNILRVQILPKE